MPEPSPLSWHLVPTFLAVLDCGSLTAAARQLGANQPTVSRHLAELEAQLGRPLFERTGRGSTPTAAALALVEGARQMAAGAEAMRQNNLRTAQARTGTVRISASTVAASWLLPPVMAALQAEEPGLSLELVASNQLSNLLRREADIAVRMLRPQQATVVARKLGEVPIVAAAHPAYLQRAGLPRRPEDLLQHRLVGYDRDDAILRGFAQMGMPMRREHFVVRTDDQVAYARLVASGAGIGFLARYTLAPLGGLVPVLPQLKVPVLPCWLVVHREIKSNPLVRRVFDALAAALPAAISA
jgi:DNA-binding transcriptional LysR family regulator